MKVCLYSHAFGPSVGGIETVSELFANYLIEKGHEVTVITQTPGSDPVGARYPVVRRPDAESLRGVLAAHDLVHANGMSVRAVWAAARGRVPVVVTHQSFNAALPRSIEDLRSTDNWKDTRRFAHALASVLAMHLARTNACISQFLCERLRPPRGIVVYNPIGRSFRPFPDTGRTDRFAFVGRLVADKGCEVLLRALAECARRGDRFGLDVYGDGPEKERLVTLARACGLSEQVSFRGGIRGEALVEAYNRSLAVVLPSVWEEPLGIVALEAMACGRAVIASAVGGLREIVQGIGLTVPKRDAAALAGALIRTARDPAFRQCCESAGEAFAQRFRIDVIGEEYLRIYRAALREAGGRRRNSLRPSSVAPGSAPEPDKPSLISAAPSAAARGVLLAHPGTQHSYEAALALQEAGLLRAFFTGFYYRPGSRPARALRRVLNGRGASLERELLRRFKPELAAENVRTYPLPELLYLASTRAGPFRRFSEDILHWRNERFDAQVAKKLARERPKAVMCFDSCARRAFERAKSLGILCVLDQSIGHIQSGLELFREEAELHPEFADSLPTRAPDWLVERCCEELRLADVVSISSAYARQTLLDHSVLAEKIILNPYGSDVGLFRPGVTPESQPFRVLFVGQVGQRKGIKYLLEAFRQLALPRAELLLVGSILGSGVGLHPYREHFIHVSHVPHAEVHTYFQSGSIFVLPSLHEGDAIAIHEALACGLPVIATPNCGSVVRDGIEGFIVPIRDVEALREKILLLYENKELREEMSRRARLRAEEFTWAAYRQRLGRLLLDCLDGREQAGG